MAVCWFIWSERNNRVFSQRYKSNVALLDSSNSNITFWLENLPTKHWETFVRSCVKKRAGRHANSRSQQAGVADRVEASCWF